MHQNTTLLSLGLVAENGMEFYAEFNDYDKNQMNPWLEEHVMHKLEFNDQEDAYKETGKQIKMKGDKIQIRLKLEVWLSQFDFIEIWADVLAYDWVLFCELFGGALKIPENIFYAPFDLGTYFRLKNVIQPISKLKHDVSRFDFADFDKNDQHHALLDAKVEMICYEKLNALG